MALNIRYGVAKGLQIDINRYHIDMPLHISPINFGVNHFEHHKNTHSKVALGFLREENLSIPMSHIKEFENIYHLPSQMR